MKTILKFLTAFLLMMPLSIHAQEFIASHVKLSKEAIGQTSSVSSDNAVLKLDDQTNRFSFSIRLFPILTSPNESDSIATLNQKISMSYKADFPIDNLEFYDAGANGKQYTMDGELSVNGITKPFRLNFYLQGAMAQDVNSHDIHSYPARISFAITINPAEYALDMETAKFTEKIIIMVENGVLNRSSDGTEQ
jgi:hypothetical protein